MKKGEHWEASALAAALQGSDEVKAGKLVVGDLHGDSIQVTLPECGNLGVVVGVVCPRIMASVVLAKASEIPNRGEFERGLLQANPLLPLSAFSLTQVDGEDYYGIYGELSTGSEIEEIEEEILTLGANAIHAMENIEAWKAGAKGGN